MSRRQIPDQEERYLALQLDDRDRESRKAGLQRLCGFYRAGFRLRDAFSVQIKLVGLLHDESDKVRRWALNALALLGRKDHFQAIIEAIDRYRDDPDTLVAGVSALFATSPAEVAAEGLKQRNIPVEGPVLVASAQYNDAQQLELRRIRVDIDRASPIELRQATLLVGMNKAPENLFSLRLQNSKIIGSLNNHDDDLVSQYSIWATVENSELGLGDLGVAIKDIESFPANVRGWIYRLIVSNEEQAAEHYEYIQVGAEESSVEARSGLATGMKTIYFDGLEEIVFDWLQNEDDASIRQRLLEHMAANAERYEPYMDPVLEAYKGSGRGSLSRARFEAATAGTELYRKLRKIDVASENLDLFNQLGTQVEPKTVVNQTFNGPTNIGAFSGTGSATAFDIQFIQDSTINESLKDTLATVAEFLKNANTPEIKAEGQKLINEVVERPERGPIAHLLGWLKGLKAGVDYVAGASNALGDIVENVGGFLT